MTMITSRRGLYGVSLATRITSPTMPVPAKNATKKRTKPRRNSNVRSKTSNPKSRSLLSLRRLILLPRLISFFFRLVSRSPVFRAMLEHDMDESRSGTIKIADVSYDALRAFVNYLYTAEAFLDNQMACNLLVLAEKYQVKHLKAYCEKYLISKLNWEKAVVNFAFAHQHNANQLQDAALAVIMENMDNLTKNEDYIELVESNPRLVVEIYEAYLGKQVNTAATHAL
ncbi:BTB/POZ domain-containing protein At4g08455-like isoform X2 [Vicia villosa]|uniref:BTB/POZ domain-containing protein At4g08455-like isoform X2 n=1 Tax=Vicia villosa TaxID=3911 RepID=UPI00273BBAE9|nr:BTB/POZ domain-containing protein At4g08455-like isoform X2 [Vicia villosa]